jgi:hypothetical protein
VGDRETACPGKLDAGDADQGWLLSNLHWWPVAGRVSRGRLVWGGSRRSASSVFSRSICSEASRPRVARGPQRSGLAVRVLKDPRARPQSAAVVLRGRGKSSALPTTREQSHLARPAFPAVAPQSPSVVCGQEGVGAGQPLLRGKSARDVLQQTASHRVVALICGHRRVMHHLGSRSTGRDPSPAHGTKFPRVEDRHATNAPRKTGHFDFVPAPQFPRGSREHRGP